MFQKYFPRNITWNLLWFFFQVLQWDKKAFSANKKLILFFNGSKLRNIGEKFVDSYWENSWKHVLNSIIDYFCLKYFFIVNWTYCSVNSWKDGSIWRFAFLQSCGCYETFRGRPNPWNIRWNFSIHDGLGQSYDQDMH